MINCRSSFIIFEHFVVCLFKIDTKASLSVIKSTQEFSSKSPQISTANKIGNNSNTHISAEEKDLCHFPAIHLDPKTAAYPKELEASECNFKL